MQGFASRLADTQASAEERLSVHCKHTPKWELPSLKEHLREASITKGSSWERWWRAVRDMRMMDYLTHEIVVTCWHKVQVFRAIKSHLSCLLDEMHSSLCKAALWMGGCNGAKTKAELNMYLNFNFGGCTSSCLVLFSSSPVDVLGTRLTRATVWVRHGHKFQFILKSVEGV